MMDTGQDDQLIFSSVSTRVGGGLTLGVYRSAVLAGGAPYVGGGLSIRLRLGQ